MKFIRHACDAISVLDAGRVIAEGEPQDVLRREEVLRAYLGRRRGRRRRRRIAALRAAPKEPAMALIEIDGIFAGYAGNEILHGVSLSLAEREVVTIIGPNGAGKSTLLKVIMGYVLPTAGEVRLNGEADHGACARTSACARASPTCRSSTTPSRR